MGYTHYWTCHGDIEPGNFASFANDCRKIIEASDVPVQYERDDPSPPRLLGDEVRFNGVEDDGHETFLIKHDALRDFAFCKTNHKPYDEIVTACLISFKLRLGDAVSVHSDGVVGEWEPGQRLFDRAVFPVELDLLDDGLIVAKLE